MTDDNNTAIDAIEIDEEILTPTLSDEALEATAGTERGRGLPTDSFQCTKLLTITCC
jgi:hypothetical protein